MIIQTNRYRIETGEGTVTIHGVTTGESAAVDDDTLAEMRDWQSDHRPMFLLSEYGWVDGDQPDPDDYDGGYISEYEESDGVWTVTHKD